jgi:hypothetical protein
MAKLKIKGLEFEAVPVRDSHGRRATQFANKIIESLKRLDLTEDDISIDMEANAMKRAPAAVSWWFEGHHLHYSHSLGSSFAENLYIAYKVIDLKVNALFDEEITLDEFISEFVEDTDVAKQRTEARALLGLLEGEKDLKAIDKAYKDLAKLHHPDTQNGDLVRFKAINNAHKILKRELT